MPPKGHRSGSTGRLGARSNSATKINAANLQFTQNPQASRGGAYDKKTPLARVNSSHRIHSKDHVPPLKRGPSAQRVNTLSAYTSTNANTNTTSKGKGFTLSAKDDHEEDDEGDWESSESGAATPLQNHDSDSEETASEADGPLHHITNALYGHHQQQRRNPEPRQAPATTTTTTANLPRIETARPNDFHAPPRISVGHDSAEPTSTMTPTLPPSQAPPLLHQMTSTATADNHTANSSNDVAQLQSQLRRMELDSTKETRTDPPQHPHPQRSSHSRQHQHPSHSQQHPPQHSQSAHTSPRHSQAGTNGSSGRRSRPPSTYSQSGSGPGKDLRPHPLIRGLSTGAVNLGRGGALAPLTVQTGAAPPQLSTSPASSIHHDHTMTTSPTSTAGSVPASWTEGPAAYLQDRRASVSSARSISTLPGQTSLYPKDAPSFLDRARTLSLMTGGSGSSAALSALSHLPTITRPPSPQPQNQVYFFPPVNPHANVEAIHPLLPASPYLGNHLTVLARRNPLRESWERVARAKRECAMGGVGAQ